VLTVTVVGVVAPVAAGISACSGEDGPTPPDAATSARVDARPAGDGGGSAVPDGGVIIDGGVADAAGVQDAGVDAAVPVDAAPDTPIT
jgi:hypothetical protein